MYVHLNISFLHVINKKYGDTSQLFVSGPQIPVPSIPVAHLRSCYLHVKWSEASLEARALQDYTTPYSTGCSFPSPPLVI